MRRLTRREGVLIYISVLLVVGSGGMLLLRAPAKAAYEANHFRLQQLQTQELMTEKRLASISQLSILGENEAKEIQYDLDAYMPVGSRASVEEYILSYLEQEELELVSTKLADEQIVCDTETEDEETGKSYIQAGNVTIHMQGKKDDFFRFLDRIEKDKLLAASAFWIYQKEDEGRMDIYMDVAYAAPGILKEFW